MITTTIPITVLAFAGALLVSLIVPSYYRAKNVPVLLSIFWLFTTSVCIAINTSGWQEEAQDKWAPFCEICAAKRRRTAIELGVGFVLPIIYVALAIINQGHRYDIIEKFGPVISIYPSVLSVLFSTAPILIASVAGTTYAMLCSYWLYMRRRQLSAVLSSSGSGINVSQYVRLFGLSCIELLWTVPVNWTIQMQNLFNRGEGGSVLFPYTSWADVHYGFGRVNLYSIDELSMTSVGRRNLPILYLGSLSSAVSCLLFFGFLGTSTETSRQIHSRIKKCMQTFIPASRTRNQVRKQPSVSNELSQPPLTPNEEVKMKHLDDERTDDIHIEVLVERIHWEESQRKIPSAQ